MPGKAYIGTSGWNYKSWRNSFYGDTPQKRWLRFCAERFTSIEVNSTFYRLQSQSTFEKWRDETPDKFPFAIKGHRYITHNKKLLDVEEPVIRCRAAASPLGERLAAVVWQLPASLKKNIERLQKFLQTLRYWETTRHAIEFRHKTWFDDEVADCLAKRAVAVCMSDAPDWPMWNRLTTDHVYIRLHGHTRKYASVSRPFGNGRRALSAGYKKTAMCTFTSTMTPKAPPRRTRSHCWKCCAETALAPEGHPP